MLREVRVENGIVRGLPAADPRITSFKGIPFAAPPVGKNRWRAPQPAEDWDGVLEAFQFAPIAMQARPGVDKNNIYSREWHVDPDIPMSEDCLYLNVWTPATSPDERLPVFVWYFGGGLQVGYTSEMEFDGERIARRGVVVVTINYRLNVFGFLCHPEITREAPDAPANFGHLDQQFATRWVQRNIAAFGGDPNNITIGGQSAGGGSVLAQLTSPQNQGLCQKAIIQSGIFAPVYPSNRMPPRGRSLRDAESDGVKFFETLGVSSLEEARRLDAKYVMAKALEYKGFWGTVADGAFCVGNSFELFLDNKRLNVPVLLGHTSSEFLSKPRVETKDQLKDLAVNMFGDDADEFLRLCEFESDSIEEVLERASVNSIEHASVSPGKPMPIPESMRRCTTTSLLQRYPGGTIPERSILSICGSSLRLWLSAGGRSWANTTILQDRCATTGPISSRPAIPMDRMPPARTCPDGLPTLLRSHMQWYSETDPSS